LGLKGGTQEIENTLFKLSFHVYVGFSSYEWVFLCFQEEKIVPEELKTEEEKGEETGASDALNGPSEPPDKSAVQVEPHLLPSLVDTSGVEGRIKQVSPCLQACKPLSLIELCSKADMRQKDTCSYQLITFSYTFKIGLRTAPYTVPC